MGVDIPSNIDFGKMMSYMFPGFFLALTSFLLIDILSNFQFSGQSISDLNLLIAFVGLLLLIGTIFGVIIDGARLLVLEALLFQKFEDIKNLRDKLSKAMLSMKDFDKYYKIVTFFRNESYTLYQFYGNVFISLIPFTFILPFYLFYKMQISWLWSVGLSYLLIAMAGVCLFCSYIAYKEYIYHLYHFLNVPPNQRAIPDEE